MPNAQCSMPNAQSGRPRIARSGWSLSIGHFALCIVAALTAACAKAPPALPSSPPVDSLRQLRADIAAAVQMPGVQRGAWGIVVHSLARDERLFELNPRTLLVPASLSKLVSVATAAEAVGWDYRFETTLRGTGTMGNGTLHGDLLVVGSGDPSIGGRAGDDLTAFVDGLKALGVRRIDGRVIGDDDGIEEPRPQLAWAWDDLGYATGAIFGALNFDENRMLVTVSPGGREGGPTTLSVEPYAAYRPLANRTVTGAPGSMALLWPEQRPGEPFLTIAGSIPAGASAARLTVSAGNPTFWFASVLRNRLLREGIDVTSEAFDVDDVMPPPDRAASMVLYTYKSHSLAEIVQPLLKESINVYGEALMRLNAAPGTFPTNDAALEGLRARLASWGVPPDGQQLVDGSGLSRRNVISPEALLTVLRHMITDGTTSPFVTALPVAGIDGSLAGRMTGTAAQGNVRAKTGTMSNVRSLAGYVTTRDGEPLAFVIMVNNFEGPGGAALQAIDAIAVRLAEFTRIP
jgi:serine-type D-Ala-D-Ala carboxypeptidase/endopeptidase (penicillin-binding protein 4)